MSILSNKALKVEKIEKISGFSPRLLGRIPTIKKKHYRILSNVSVGGDAPKELIRTYSYIQGKKQSNNPRLWELNIAKTGHKWYPYESITEYLLNKLGCCIELNMADARLAVINGQIRFLSRFFLDAKNQVLEHGAELYGGYLNDQPFVESIELANKARDFFTVRFTKDTLKHLYPHQADDLFINFLKMLVFDAILGNNDRHFYNWGIVKHIHNVHQPYFAPIYDTARALCWHTPEEKIYKLHKDRAMRQVFLEKYVNNSKPKTGIERLSVKNHFELIRALQNGNFPEAKEIIPSLINIKNQKSCHELLMDEMRYLMSKERLAIVAECLDLRFKRLISLAQ